MDKLFYADSSAKREILYGELFDDLGRARHYSPYCKSGDFYEVFKRIVLSLLLGREIILLDSDFTDEEMGRLLGTLDITEAEEIEVVGSITEENFLTRLLAKAGSWSITLFTSGTTGLPKRVSHGFASISRQVRRGDQHAGDVWGFAYNPTHMAGLQVFFQALMNRNSLIRLFGLDQKAIVREIRERGITHISATPTFYRWLLPPTAVCDSVRRLTSGGEKFDGPTWRQLEGLFPNARLTNVYASTEVGTLFASKGNEFVIGEEMADKVCVRDGELLIHKSLLGRSETVKVDGDWYHTGDLVEIVTEDPLSFHFVSRKNEMINVGGYKVNPTEVEECLRACEDVMDAKVYGKASRMMGNIVVCDVVRAHAEVSERRIREELRGRLQEFKIPRVIKFVEHLGVTRTGKLSRQ